MSTVKWTNPNNETQQYDIGTIGWELRRDNSLAGAFADIFRATYPLLPLSALFLAASVAMDPGSAVPTYGLWAGPGWNAGSRTPEGGDIDWEKLPCYNNNIKNIENNPELNPDDCISLVDAITKTHDWRYVRPLKSIHMLRCAAVLGVATYTKSTPHFSGFARLASERI